MLFLLVSMAYVLGSIPSGLIVGLLTSGRDVREHGSGNIGAANVTSMAGWRAGAAVGGLDILKGVTAVALGRAAGFDHSGLALVALAAVCGHDFSLFLRFRGGKGVATTFGVALALAPPPGVLTLVTWVAVLLVTGFAALASLGALAALPLLLALNRQPGVYVLVATVLFSLGAAKHAGNIVRLLRGQEPRIR
jgi:glycerol-3-phosphate acyltransferase PlsY